MRSNRPYRLSLLTQAQLRELNVLRPGIAVRDTLLLWAQILAAWAIVAVWPAWWVAALAVPVIGTRYYGLYIIGHDGLHRRLFRDARLNDLWNDALIIGAIGAITRLNRRNHIQHHATLASLDDPDRYKYINANKATRSRHALALTGLPYVIKAIGNVFLDKRARSIATVDNRHSVRDLAILVCWQAGLIGGLTMAIGWWAYPALWLLPVYTFTYAADIVRVFLEHAMPGDDHRADADLRLISYRSSAIERRFFAPMNMNFHAAHHLWPSIPYYNLGRADMLMRQSAGHDSGLIWRDSYLAYLWAYWRSLPWARALAPEVLSA